MLELASHTARARRVPDRAVTGGVTTVSHGYADIAVKCGRASQRSDRDGLLSSRSRVRVTRWNRIVTGTRSTLAEWRWRLAPQTQEHCPSAAQQLPAVRCLVGGNRRLGLSGIAAMFIVLAAACTSPPSHAEPSTAGHAAPPAGVSAGHRGGRVLGSSHIKTSHLSVASPDYASIAFGDGGVWVLTYPVSGKATSSCGRLLRVSAATAAVTGAVPIPLCPDGVAYGQGSVWVLSFAIDVRGYQLVRVNPATLAIESVTRIDAGRHGVTPRGDTGAKYLFVTATKSLVFAAVQDPRGRSQIVAVDPATGNVATKLTLSPSEAATALGVNHDAVWVGTDSGRVLGLDPATGAVRFARRVGTRVISLSASGRGVWVTVNVPAPPRSPVPGLDVLRLDPATGAIVTDTDLPMIFVATDGSSVWALSSAPPFSSDSGLVAQVNPATGVIVKRAELPTMLGSQPPYTIGVYRGSAWVINDFLRTLTKISP